MMDFDEICLWAAVGQSDAGILDRTLRVLRYCDSLALWNAKLLFTVVNPSASSVCVPGLKIIQLPVPVFERMRWEIMVAKVMPAILEQYPFTLAIHDDGFPLDVSLWQSKFLDYDYVGAPWDYSGVVGSGGCALTSDRLNQAMIELPWYDGNMNVDEWVCRVHRDELISQGIRFAPPEVAVEFCTETTDHDAPSFAYHGRNHAVKKHEEAWKKLIEWESTQS